MSLVEFEKHEVVKDFMDIFDVYHTNLGVYHYSKDGSPCYYLNGMLTMFEEQQNKIDTLISHINEALDGFEDGEFNYCHKQLMKALGDKT